MMKIIGIVAALLMLCVPTARAQSLPQTLHITSPADFTVVTAPALVVEDNSTGACGGLSWYSVLVVDGVPGNSYGDGFEDCNFGTCMFDPSGWAGGATQKQGPPFAAHFSHTLQIFAHKKNPGHGFCDSSPPVTIFLP